MKTFFNDDYGLTISEFVSFSFCTVYLILVITIFIKGDNLNEGSVKALEFMKQPMLIILTGHFGISGLNKYLNKKK